MFVHIDKRSFSLLKAMVITDFKLRYNDSFLGYVWSLLRPLLLFVTLYIVFAKFLKVGQSIPHYPVYLLLGIVLWNYFAEVTSGSVTAIVGRGDLLRKINFPKYIIILAGSVSAFINLVLNFVIIGVFMVISGVSVSWHAIWIVPIIAELFVVSIALAFLLSALFVSFRDISYIWEVIMQAAFYATPILYPLTFVPHKAAQILILNPIAQLIQDARYVLITDHTITIRQLFSHHVWVWFLPIIITAGLAVLTAAYFRSQSKFFAEKV